jgi:membrane-associated phospholipid phosphatase
MHTMHMNIFLLYSLYRFVGAHAFLKPVVVFLADVFPYCVLLSAVLFFAERFLKAIKTKVKKEKIFVLYEGVYVACAVSLSWILATVLKILFKIPRPFVSHADIVPFFPEHGYAFPSQHAIFFMSLGFALFLLNKKRGVWFVCAALLIGGARICAGVHYPFDIATGFVLGGSVSFLLYLVFKGFKKK